jgi:hypothetical protein
MERHRPHFFHSGTEQHIAKGAKDHDQQNQKIRLEVAPGMTLAVVWIVDVHHFTAILYRELA